MCDLEQIKGLFLFIKQHDISELVCTFIYWYCMAIGIVYLEFKKSTKYYLI